MRNTLTAIVVLWIATSVAVVDGYTQSSGSNAVMPRADEVVIRPGDVLSIQVWPDAQLGGEFAVEESGNVYLPFLGQVAVVGMPLSHISATLRAGYAEVIKEPVVTVTPQFRVGVLGEVRSPGLHRATPTTTLMDLIGMAGGFTAQANQARVRLVRDGQAFEINAARLLREGDALHSLALRSGDYLIVPRQSSFRLNNVRDLLTVLQTVMLAVNVAQRVRR
jgi:polysaccharide biosynthesis/export protein